MHTPLYPLIRRTAPAVLLGLALTLGQAPAEAQRFELSPGPEVLAGEPLQIVLSGLPAQATVTLRALRTLREFTGQTRPFVAEAQFKADAQGRIDLATQAPLSGSYAGADVRGLFWSMTPATASDAPAEAGHVLLQARLREGDTERVVAQQTVQLKAARPDVQERAAQPFPGAVLAALPGAARRPALILLGGSEGGSMVKRDAPFWASRGYAVLALPYYSPAGWGPNGPTPPELPTLPAAFADIPVERLEQARAWLAEQPEVDAARIAVMGTSKGAEFALLAATKMAWIRAVVAIVPSDVVWEGWGPGVEAGKRASFAWQGRPFDFVPYQDFQQEFAGFGTGQPVIIRRPHDKGRAAHPERAANARIPVEVIAAPVLVAGGHDDQIWNSGAMSEAIVAARTKAGRETVAVIDREAGHYLGGTGWNPTTHYNAGPMKAGGTPQANARAQAELLAKSAAFLARHLGPVAR